jgi:NADH-quinone oxidoreductase subunit E
LLDDLRDGRLTNEIPAHGTLARTRQHIPADKAVGAVAPEHSNAAPAWLAAPEAAK